MQVKSTVKGIHTLDLDFNCWRRFFLRVKPLILATTDLVLGTGTDLSFTLL